VGPSLAPFNFYQCPFSRESSGRKIELIIHQLVPSFGMPGELRSMLIKDFTAFPLGNFLLHAMKACRGREDISPLIRHLGSRQNPWYPSSKKLGGPHSRVWKFWREVSLLLGFEPRMVRPLA
jgi:hypothetical protein